MKHARATYGAFDNSHRLLSCDDSQVSPPRELEGLTDRPPGDISPVDIWWPSVGCGPVGDWWCIWWTVPDTTASRAGMVRSEVALWPREQIGLIEDLVPILTDISGGMTIEPAPQLYLAQVADALLSGKGHPVIICESLEVWPSIISGIWRHLWPAARMEFSARLALNPPQNTEPSGFPWIICTPLCRAQQWQHPFKKVELSNSPTAIPPSRAAKYLAGQQDLVIAEVLQLILPKQSNLTHLKQMSRIADNLEKLNTSGGFSDALALLRTLVAAAPTNDEAGQYKKIAMSVLLTNLPIASSGQIELLANIDFSAIPENKDFEECLRKQVGEIAPHLRDEKMVSFLVKLQQGKAQPWWQTIVTAVLRNGLGTHDELWSQAAIKWLAAPEVESVANDLIKDCEAIEGALLNAANKQTWNAAEIQQLRKQAQNRKWYFLHAWCLVSLKTSVVKAFAEQKSFVGASYSGFEFLIQNLPADEVVKTVVNGEDSKLCKLAAQLTKQQPTLLRLIDMSKLSSRLLWAAHIELGGQAWPELFQPEVHGISLLEVIANGSNSCGLVEFVGPNLSQVAADHPRRKEFWVKLSAAESNVLLPLVAKILIGRMSAGKTVARPEPPLEKEIMGVLRSSRPTGFTICILFAWGVPLSEREIIDWISQFTRVEWQIAATQIGQAILRQHWSGAAQRLYDLRRSIPEAIPALEICKDLLPMWDRLLLSFSGSHSKNNATSDYKMALIDKVTDIGSDLAPDGLDEIWERAGGKKKELEIKGTAYSRWHHAVRLAANGGKCSLADIIRELKRDYPNNSHLHEIETVLRSFNLW